MNKNNMLTDKAPQFIGLGQTKVCHRVHKNYRAGTTCFSWQRKRAPVKILKLTNRAGTQPRRKECSRTVGVGSRDCLERLGSPAGRQKPSVLADGASQRALGHSARSYRTYTALMQLEVAPGKGCTVQGIIRGDRLLPSLTP
jgi:hypothetical protein